MNALELASIEETARIVKREMLEKIKNAKNEEEDIPLSFVEVERIIDVCRELVSLADIMLENTQVENTSKNLPF